MEELELVNSELCRASAAEIAEKSITTDGSPPAVHASRHFMVLDEGAVTLDHVFGDGEAVLSAPDPDLGKAPVFDTLDGKEPQMEPTKGELCKKLPLMTVSALSLVFRNEALWLGLDATVRLGPLEFSLLQFALGIKLSSTTLHDLSSVTPFVDLRGLAVSLSAPPVSLAGVLVR